MATHSSSHHSRSGGDRAHAGSHDRDRGRDNDRGEGAGGGRKTFHRRKSCRFCIERDLKINYKEPAMLLPFMSDRSKIIPRRISGNCAKHQRDLTTAIKRARQLALLAYTDQMGEA